MGRKIGFSLAFILILIFFPILLAACGSDEPTATPLPLATRTPTATPTPRSTELPAVPTIIPPGSQADPLKIAIIGEADGATNRLISNLERALNEELSGFRIGYYSGLYVDIVMIPDQAAALDLLCNSSNTAVLADVFTYMAAERQCGAWAAYQVLQDGETGQRFDFILNSAFVNRIEAIGRDRTYCALGLGDPLTFVYPALALRSQGFDPFTDFAEIVIVDSLEALVANLASQDRNSCVAGALPSGMLEDILETIINGDDPATRISQALANRLIVFEPEDNPWPEIPYSVLAFPPERQFPLYLVEQLIGNNQRGAGAIDGALNVVLSDDNAATSALLTLIQADGLQRVTPADYDEFREWLAAAGWNMAAVFAP